jgi:hypothetical protein
MTRPRVPTWHSATGRSGDDEHRPKSGSVRPKAAAGLYGCARHDALPEDVPGRHVRPNVPRAATASRLQKSAGELFEESVKNTFRKKIIRQNEILRDSAGRVVGQIDFETSEAIYEVGISLRGKVGQLHKLAEVAKQRAKRLDVVYGPDTPPGTLEFLKESLRKKWGNRVRFIPHE